MTTLLTLCFVVPCFNEEDNVGATVGSIREAMGRRVIKIVLVHRSYLGADARIGGRRCSHPMASRDKALRIFSAMPSKQTLSSRSSPIAARLASKGFTTLLNWAFNVLQRRRGPT